MSGTQAGVKTVDISDELKSNFLVYAEEVIRNRAIPDIRDGLKPVHRRILWAMREIGAKSTAQTKKSARIVGDVLGRYHPHSDTAVYDSMVRLAQPFALSVPLVEGRGNFGSVDGYAAAASRYTEARLSRFGEFVLFSDIDDDTVDFIDNYTGEFKEPVVLPVRVPLVLLTAASGIAVGMATTFLPHNLTEVCNALIAVVDKPKIDIIELVKYLPCPDFPLGGMVRGDETIAETYKTGKGPIRFRASTSFEFEGRRKSIIIQNIPYGTNKTTVIQEIAELVRSDKIEGISEIRDESAKNEIRICIELKTSAGHEAILNQLYKHTRLETSFSMNSVVISKRKPKLVGLLGILLEFVEFRREVIRKRTLSQKKKAEIRLEIVDGLLWAVAHHKEVADIAHGATDPVKEMMHVWRHVPFTKRQAEYILNMPLRRLSMHDRKKLNTEKKELTAFIQKAEGILKSQKKVDAIIKMETEEIRDKFGTPRVTSIVSDFTSITAREMVKQQEIVMVFMSDNTMKATPLSEYRLTRRRSMGVTGVKVPDGIYPVFAATVNTHDDVLLITDMGNRYILRAYDLPTKDRVRKPYKLADYLPAFRDDESVVAVTKANLDPDEVLVILSERGIIKKQSSTTVMKARATTTLFYPVDKGGKVVSAIVAKNDSDIVVATSEGQQLRTSLTGIREVAARLGVGVRCVRLKDGHRALSISEVDPDGFLLTVSRLGYVKRTPMVEFLAQARGGKGKKCTALLPNDVLIFASAVPRVDEESNLFMLTNHAKAVRVRISEVPIRARVARGNLSKRLEQGESPEVIQSVSVE